MKVSDGEHVFGAIKHKAIEKYSNRLPMQKLLKACKQAGILTEASFAKADDIRDKRNRIHLAGLGNVDNVYAKADVQQVFQNATFILKRIELMLAKL